MKKIHTFYCLFAGLLLMATTACERRPLVDIDAVKMDVVLNVDWSEYNATLPERVTFLCYPENGGRPTVIESDNITRTEARLIAGTYKIYALSGLLCDYDCYSIEQLPELAIHAVEGEELLPLGIDCVGLDVPYLKGEEITDVTVTAPTLYPRNIVWTSRVEVFVSGYDNVTALEADYSGLKASFGQEGLKDYHLAPEKWKGSLASQSFTAEFACLGLPEDHEGKAEENVLTMNFTLKSGDVVERVRNIGSQIKVDNERQLLSVKVSAVVSVTAGGYDIDVEPWYDED